MNSSGSVSSALDAMFERPGGLYGELADLPIIAAAGHHRRIALLERLDVGDVSKMTVADFGIGSWGFGSVYPRIQSCARAIGFDISNAAIRMTQELIRTTQPVYADRFEAHQSDGMLLPIEDECVDLFFSGESIEHVKFPLRYLSEIYRVLKDDGQLVLTTPNRDATLYKQKGEEYCASPEHFWLFNYDELIRCVSVFFDIQETYGFNGTFGGYAEDREVKDRGAAEAWSCKFEHEPHLASGIVLRARKIPGVTFAYEIDDIPEQNVQRLAAGTYLDLEFGLKGLLLESPEDSVKLLRPPSDGVVCRLWAHRWSGLARVDVKGERHLVDLYSFDPGWKVWQDDRVTQSDSVIEIRKNCTRNPKALHDQVIYFEAFTWRVVDRLTGRARVAKQVASDTTPVRQLLPAVPVAGYGFAKFQIFVGTTVFHWFAEKEGNVRGPWQPLGGRASWTGDIAFWRKQIKQIMLANIDAIYLHLIEKFEEPRINFFKAYAELRREGYDVPKVAPFVDPNILFSASPIDVATNAGKDEYCRHLIRFYEQFFSANTDLEADSFLLTVDGRLTISSWWPYWLLKNLEQLSAADIVRRLAQAFPRRLPQLKVGVYMIGCALINPDYSFADERMVTFSGYAYAIHSVHNSVDVWHVQPGYWDQNIRSPGYFLPRDGGKNYRRAWDAVRSALPNVHRVYVESWNEYDEGSGIYAADPKELFVDRNMHSNVDSFSDTQNPFEYVLTTADGAAQINGRPEWSGAILSHDTPDSAAVGELITVTFLARNEGNRRWCRGGPQKIIARTSIGKILAEASLCVPSDGEFEENFGLPRGYPTIWTARFRMPDIPGRFPIVVGMIVDGKEIGSELRAEIKVVEIS